MAQLTPRYHAFGTTVQRTPEAASAYGIAARLAALAGRTRNASRDVRYHLKMMHNWDWARVDAANQSVLGYQRSGVLA